MGRMVAIPDRAKLSISTERRPVFTNFGVALLSAWRIADDIAKDRLLHLVPE
jgi:hypothetical protein